MSDLPDKITITWHIEDVLSLDNKLTKQEAREILQAFEHHHDGSMIQMWDDLKYHTDEYKEERDRKIAEVIRL